MTRFLKCMAFAVVLAAAAAPAAVAQPAPVEEFPLPAGFTGAYREVDGVRLHYVTGGQGPVVLLVHGFGQTWYEWRQLMPLLARSHTVVAPDLPGLGLSGPPRSYAGQDVSDTLYKFARSLSPSAKFDLVAHDIGIWNTYPIAVLHQADIGRIAYMEAPIPDASIYKYPAFTPELLDLYARSYAKPDSLHAAFDYYRALNETERRNAPLAATKITVPVLAIGGGGHGGFGTAEADQVRQYATHVEGLSLPGCGHWLPEECAGPLNNAVVEFLDRD